jgi:nitroreductase
MEMLEGIRRRRSARGLGPVSIPRAHLETIVDAGRLAPSGKNAQPWEFIVITRRETIAQLAQVQALLGQASAVVAVVVDEQASPFWLEDASAATENMLLAMEALGYGSRWIEGTLRPKEAWAKEVLGVPADKRLVILLPIGAGLYPEEPKPKRALVDVLHWERFGNRTWEGPRP